MFCRCEIKVLYLDIGTEQVEKCRVHKRFLRCPMHWIVLLSLAYLKCWHSNLEAPVWSVLREIVLCVGERGALVFD